MGFASRSRRGVSACRLAIRAVVATALVLMVCLVGIGLPASTAGASTLSYSALGDSYASGVGTFDYYATSGTCDRSPDAYAPIIAAAKGFSLNFAACSGATTTTVIGGQLGGLNASTSLVTVSAGGNNIGFATVLETCAEYGYIDIFGWDPCQSAINTAETQIANGLAQSLDTLYAAIAARAPNAHVDVVGYPHLFDASGDVCPFGGTLGITQSEALQMNQGANALDSVIATQAAQFGFTFVDPTTAFAGHELCSSDPWINGVSVPVVNSFHPTVGGYQALVGLVESAGL